MLTVGTWIECIRTGCSMPPSAAGSIVVSNLRIESPLPPEQTARLLALSTITVLSWHWRPAAARRTTVASAGSEILILKMSMPWQVPLEPPL
jgi:hypothetical protein